MITKECRSKRSLLAIKLKKSLADKNIVSFLIRSLGNITRDDVFIENFVHKFYNDKNFQFLYYRWLEKDKNKWYKPSIDHIYPKCLGGTDNLLNLTFITFFENKAKYDMSPEEWEAFKKNTKTQSDLFICINH